MDEPRPLCIVEHPGSHVSDLALVLTTKLTAGAGIGWYPPAREFPIRAD
jgi:hypothetical protein